MAGMITIRRVSRILLSPVIWIIVILMGAGLFYGSGRFMNQDDATTSLLYQGPSAKVNGVEITDADFNKVLGPLTQNYGQMYPPDQLKDEALKRCVNDEIIRQYIAKWHIRTSDQEVQRFMQKQIYANYKTPEELQTLYTQVGVKNKGDLEKMVREQLDRKNFFAELGRRWKVPVSDAEVAAKYEQVELSHILIATNKQVNPNPPSDADALKKANEAYAKIKAGADFASVATEYSDDSGSKANGGSLGRHDLAGLKQQFDPNFMAAAEKLKVGEVSQPVKSQFGYHIIKLIDRTEAKGKDFNTVKGDLRRDVLAEKLFATKNDQLTKWLEKQAEGKLEIIDPALRAFRLKKEQKWTEAAEAYDKALNIGHYKKDLSIYLSDAEVLKEAKRYDEAIKILKKFPTDGRVNVQVQMTIAEIYDAKGDKEKAKSMLNREVVRASEDVDTLRRIQSEMSLLKYDDEAKALGNKIAETQAKIDKEQADYQELIKKQQEADQLKKGESTKDNTTTQNSTTTQKDTTTNSTTK